MSSLLKGEHFVRHRLETSSVSESIESSDDGSQVVVESTRDEGNGKGMRILDLTRG